MRRASYRDVLIDPDNRYVWTDRGVEWVTDRFSMVRTDVIGRRIQSKGALGPGGLSPNRMRAPVFGFSLDDCIPVRATKTTIDRTRCEPMEVVSVSRHGSSFTTGPYYLFDSRVLAGLTQYAGNPLLTPRRTLVFVQRRRGKMVRAAVLMPCRLSHGMKLHDAEDCES